MLLNAEMELTASDGTEEKTRVGEKAVLLKAGKEKKTLTAPQGPGGDCEPEKSEARRPATQSKPIITFLLFCNRRLF